MDYFESFDVFGDLLTTKKVDCGETERRSNQL